MSTPFCEHRIVPRKQRKSGYHHGNLRSELIQTSLQLIQEKGIRALTLREIGARLGVSRSAAYRHFADKAALLSAISEAGFIEFGNALEAAKSAAAPDFASQMDAMGRAYVRFAGENRAHFEVMFSEPLEPGYAAALAADRSFGILEQTIRDGQQSGAVQAGDSNLLARVVWAQIHGISILRLDGDPTAPEFVGFSGNILRGGLSKRSSHGISADRNPETPTRSADSPSVA